MSSFPDLNSGILPSTSQVCSSANGQILNISITALLGTVNTATILCANAHRGKMKKAQLSMAAEEPSEYM